MIKYQDSAAEYSAPFNGYCLLASGVGDNGRPTYTIHGNSFTGGYSTGSYLNMSETISFPVKYGQIVKSHTNQSTNRAFVYFIPFVSDEFFVTCIKY